ncbi:PQQ-binding-like beta-propeller repeat protein [Verrucomicrobium spinosum]|uniref:outer membrane protein assembly factor BamB family protein n=1 Tax=Verrucomicrobium spinosum TaxID=2736 RepID=UPI0009462A3E|nr:PQQ-binding-like beta-propeller repeat protein [Verrucomicrobium spinosum]
MHHRFTPVSRSLSLLALMAAVNLCAVAIHPVRASGTEEWPRFRGPDGNGRWNPAGRPADLAESEPRLLWKAPLGGGYGGVTVAQGKVYVMDRQSGSGKAEVERVLCFDAANGKLHWEHSYPTSYDSMDYGNGPRASVTVHEGRAYTLGARGVAVCLDAITGKVHWQVDLVKDTVASSPPGVSQPPPSSGGTPCCCTAERNRVAASWLWTWPAGASAGAVAVIPPATAPPS